MGARLVYAKVIDKQLYLQRGGEPTPGLDNDVVVNDEPGIAATFHVLRAWTDDEGGVSERWTIESPGGLTLYEAAPRELHFPTREYVEHLEDEVANLKVDYAADYTAVFYLDEHEVARVTFPIRRGAEPGLEA
jgi:hypothetical protein